jgi:hypothetical protein
MVSAAHFRSGGNPEGANFVFEDGSVIWHNFAQIGHGGSLGDLVYFYDISSLLR